MDSAALNFRAAPEPLTLEQRVLFWIFATFAAVTRWPAISLSLWDWDEALFTMAMRDYDVPAHRPHPPGFPLFIAAAKLIPLDDFHALQGLTVIASLFVFPAMFFLARELRASAFTAMAAGLLLSFFPNVWFYGGTALSDVPSMVLGLVSAALLLRGCRNEASLIGGAIVLGVAAGFRPQNLIIGFAPFVIAFLHRRRTAMVGAVLTAVICVASYGTAAMLSGGWDVYRAAVMKHQRYIREIDSFLGTIRPSLVKVADDFFLRPYRAPLINILVCVLSILGLRSYRRALVAIAVYGPFLLFAWLFLDFHSASRFSIGYMPMYAMLAAEGIPRRGRTMTLMGVLAVMIVWTWPALRIVHTTVSPPVAAAAALPRDARIFVDDRVDALAELLLRDREWRLAKSAAPIVAGRRAVLMREGASSAPGAKSFVRERERLAGIARARYFEMAIVPARAATIVDGRRVVFPSPTRGGELTMRVAAEEGAVVRVDGRALGRVVPGTTVRTWRVDAPRELVIEGRARIEWVELVPRG